MPTPPSFSFDVFLSHSSKDKAVVRPIAERLRADGLRVWLDEWEIKPGDSIPAKIEEGLEHSRVLVLCMSANAFGSDWAQLESGTFRFRDPLNKDRRFIPLRLDDTPLKAALAQFMYINWQLENRDQEYAKLLESCQPPSAEQTESLARRQAEGQPEARQGDEGSQRRTKLAVLSWRESLEVIGGQFEARAEQSQGLHHLFVEASDDERTRLAGPDWFARLSPPSAGKQVKAQIKEPWQVIAFDSLPDVHPDFRELTPGEPVDGLRDDQMIRDTSGIPRAAAIRMRLREGYLCGDNSQLGAFESLAQAASQVLTDELELKNHPFAEDLCDLFRRPRGGVRFVFGDVSSRPTEFVARGWTTGVLASPHGVLIDMPISEEFPGVGHWLLLLHRLSWRRHKGCPLIGARYAWHENVTVPYESLSEPGQLDGVPPRLKETFANISGTSFYSILGERERPLDVNLASVFAIRLILSAMSTRTRGR